MRVTHWHKRRARVGAAACLALASSLFLLEAEPGTAPARTEQSDNLARSAQLTTQRAQALSPPRSPARPAAQLSMPQALARAARESERAPPRPHPVTAERERMQHELQLIGALNDALDVGDADRMRMLVDIYREYHPEDPNQLQRGYELLSDCLESVEHARPAARAYYDEARASPLRRFVRRLCLEPEA